MKIKSIKSFLQLRVLVKFNWEIDLNIDMNRLNKSIKDVVESSNGGVESFVIYNKTDGLVITGENINYEKSAIYHSIFLDTQATTQNFKFSKEVEGYYILLKNNKITYSSSLFEDFLFTVVLDLNKMQLGYFKGVLLKKFFEENNS